MPEKTLQERRREANARWRAKHPEKAKELSSRFRKANPEKARAAALKHYYANKEALNAKAVHKNRKRKFGITRDQFEALLESQGGVCAICRNPETATRQGKVKSLAVDHDHASGKIRGLLCMACNTMIGNSKERLEVLQAAILYLKTHASPVY